MNRIGAGQSSGPRIRRGELTRQAGEQGLTVYLTENVQRMEEAAAALTSWQDRGCAGEMGYMNRPATLLAEPRALMPNVRSILVLMARYSHAPKPERPEGYGRVARYAWGLDYHKVLKQRLECFRDSLKTQFSNLETRIFSDAVPLLERSLAQQAGAGFLGRNSMLIRPGVGSLFFLGELFTNFEIEDENPGLAVLKGSCGTCERCVKACPTLALDGSGMLDARRCISYLSIEKRGRFDSAQRTMLGEWIFGCDICQEVCPFNFTALKGKQAADFSEFDSQGGVGPLLELNSLFSIRKKTDFERRFARTPLIRTKREGLIRNAASVAVSTNSFVCMSSLEELCTTEADAGLRAIGVWAWGSLARRSGIISLEKQKSLLIKCSKDPDHVVRDEAIALLRNL